MEKVTKILFFLSVFFLMASFFVVASDFNSTVSISKMTNMLASAVNFDVVSKNDMSKQKKPDKSIKIVIPKLPDNLTGSTTTATTTEQKINISNWNLLYRKNLYDSAGAYTLKYPDNWESLEVEGKVALTYDYNNNVYSLLLDEMDESVNINEKEFDKTLATTTQYGDYEFIKKSYIKNGTTTQIVYIPTFAPTPFAKAVATLPAEASAQFEDIFARIFETLLVEPIKRPFKIDYIKVHTPVVSLKSKTSIPTKLVYSWRLSHFQKTARNNFIIYSQIEDDYGKVLYRLPNITSINKTKAQIELPPVCENDQVIENCIHKKDVNQNKQYRISMVGYACQDGIDVALCPEDMRVYATPIYSDNFLIQTPKIFSDFKVSLNKTELKGQYTITASFKVYSNSPTDKYVLLLDDGTYVSLRYSDGLYKTKFVKKFTKGSHKLLILKTNTSVIDNNFYGAETIDELSSYGNMIYSKDFDIK